MCIGVIANIESAQLFNNSIEYCGFLLNSSFEVDTTTVLFFSIRVTELKYSTVLVKNWGTVQ